MAGRTASSPPEIGNADGPPPLLGVALRSHRNTRPYAELQPNPANDVRGRYQTLNDAMADPFKERADDTPGHAPDA